MTKLTAKERMKLQAKVPVVPPPAAPAGTTQVERHLICPLCSMVAGEERYHDGPYESKSRIQHYGGSLPSPTGLMRNRPGVIIWDSPEPLTAIDIDLLLDRLSKAEDLLKGMTPALLEPPPLPPAPPITKPVPVPSAPPRPKPPEKPAKPAKKPEVKMTKAQLKKAAEKFLIADAHKHDKELKKLAGADQVKLFIMGLWDEEDRRNPKAPHSRAVWELSDRQREAVLSKVVEAVKPELVKPAPAPPKEKPVTKPAPVAPPVTPAEVATEKAEEIVEALEKKWRDAKARNSKLAEQDLDELEMRWGYDVGEAREKLQEYKDVDRADFESAEEYSEARADAWQEFVDSIGTISKEEGS